MFFRIPTSLCAIALASVLACAATAAPVTAVLRAELAIDHAEVEFSDLAALGGDPGKRAVLAHLVVCPAPRVGYVQRITPAMLNAVARRSGLIDSIEWSGASSVQVSTVAQQISGQAIMDAVATALQEISRKRKLDYTIVHAVDGVEAPVGATHLLVRPIDASVLAARTAVWVDIVVDGKVYRSIPVPVDLKREESMFVARTDLRAGATVSAEQFIVEQRNAVGQRQLAVTEMPSANGARLAHPIRTGEVLTIDKLLAPNNVITGDHVHVVARAGSAAIEMDGIVVRGGANGQAVEVLVAHSQQPLTGMLVDGHTVAVE